MNQSIEKNTRLHYLDWLQVIAILGVFLFHAVHPFDDLFSWHIKNEKTIMATNFFVGFFGSWGMPFFFLMAGATSWFSLRHRTAALYIKERIVRLLIPFLIGSFFLTPFQAYFELTHKGLWEADSFLSFLFNPDARGYFYTQFHLLRAGPRIFGALGYHLWFVGFLFAFSLLATPIFIYLKSDSGQQILNSLVKLSERRGGLLLFAIPPIISRLILQPYFPNEHDWADFVFMLLYFMSGFILIGKDQFRKAIRRDWLIHLVLGITCTLVFFSSAVGVPVFEWLESTGTIEFFIIWIVIGLNSWCWTMFIFNIGIRYLNYSNRWLQYGREASYPFFFIHQPTIIFIAFFVVQWQVSTLLKLLIVVLGSFALSLGLYELLVRRIPPIRAIFGMKPRKT